MFDFEDEFEDGVVGFSDYAYGGLPQAQPIIDQSAEQGNVGTTINTQGSL